ncbi:MAG: thioredoxin-disulfide reductase [Patescibacteria group bacterium]|nr:MAG: thioredoxin-disulfide reductase [Patescibacteria group bacterium]
MDNLYDVIIIGSGPAGLTAAIYTTRAALKTLVIAGEKWGGQLMLTSLVENFPGFPEGIQGPELMMRMRKQAENHGAKIIDVNFTEGDFTHRPFILRAGGKEYKARAVIIASGADARWLNVPGEKELIGKGVSSCATCDAMFFRGKNVFVVGGGDSAMEEALVLAKVANSVTVIHRRDSLRASEIMQRRAKENPKIKFLYNSIITEIKGKDKVESAVIQDTKTGEKREVPVDGIFVAIGHIPNTKMYQGIDLDNDGYIKVYNHFHTNVPGVFTAGDVHDRSYRQAITAAGFGAAAALEAERWLSSEGKEIQFIAN